MRQKQVYRHRDVWLPRGGEMRARRTGRLGLADMLCYISDG